MKVEVFITPSRNGEPEQPQQYVAGTIINPVDIERARDPAAWLSEQVRTRVLALAKTMEAGGDLK